MFNKILIANRGEIACRIISTCKKMGIKTVAVYSDADAGALHVSQAGEAQRIGPPPANDSYLSISAIIQAALKTGTQAIHPGYGFLSQNTALASACSKEGIVFIGPKPQVMDRMKDKLTARKLAQEAGIPVVPGTERAVKQKEAIKAAKELGFPIMVKAAGGGGGIGIILVRTPSKLEEVIHRVKALAKGAFGNDEVYLERYLSGASHIEVQVLGDNHGNLVHLFERDCSIQRRNQKVIEESPSPKLDNTLRRSFYDAALALAKHIGYTNAGTVEFLMDSRHQFYFLEMNTRLQVEHGITEAVTGLDIVELQIRIAAGESLPITQKSLSSKEHAIEARIYPEDPTTFLPSMGVIKRTAEPKGDGIRVDSSLFAGYEVSPYYDPLLAKVIAWGKDRNMAIERLDKALAFFDIQGVPTNIPTLRSILGGPSFLSGSYNTQLLSRMASRRRSKKALAPQLTAAIASAISYMLRNRSSEMVRKASSWKLSGRRELMLSRIRRG